MILPIALVLLVTAIFLWWLSSRLQQQTGLPRARVVYDDASASRIESPPLVDHRWKIAGRPDYLLEQNGGYIPVEVKPTRRANQPYESDLMQLAAYCHLVEVHYGIRPTHGLLRYANHTFEIPYTDEVEEALGETLRLMAEMERKGTAHRSHQQPARCRSCSQRAYCDEALS
jgi:CRISPR-associated exonuclease Cas4